ncbi:hypothetical protein HY639_05850 [Candidatus Woesearchaeota archaeon]|nr:hypothetical protein [Candidatus Woesearchaeota archaeon]
MSYRTGRVKRVATQDELGEIKADDGGIFIPYGIDDINEEGMKRWRKKGFGKEDQVSFRVSKEGFAIDITAASVSPLRRKGGKSA